MTIFFWTTVFFAICWAFTIADTLRERREHAEHEALLKRWLKQGDARIAELEATLNDVGRSQTG